VAVSAIRGRDGWLFLSGDSNDALGQFTGKVAHTEISLSKWAATLRRRRAFFDARGISYFFFVAPDTNAIYPEMLPDEVTSARIRPIDKLIEAAWVDADFEVIYPLIELRREKKRALVCQKTDSHLSGFGGWVLAQAALRRINGVIDVPIADIKDIRYKESLEIGDLGSKFEPPISGATTHVNPRSITSKMIYFNNIQNRGGIRIYENKNEFLPKCVLFSDSYGHYTAPHLANSFSRLVYVHSPFVDIEIVEKEMPNVVLSIFAERFCISPPDDLAYPSLLQLIKEKLGSKNLTAHDYPWIEDQYT
jgi:hypothetical protein